ncbi:hypothetical protein QEH52_16235 [Coraliomargarita sp. SDUM461003]|uniref:PEP-CTERM protein-sorting domain-containing protein n=1 Tax=Thalassobacterium maritimum TaxID=3041265 RepID=A0ABU1B0T7_9BACT|nr:hypothetical protein [Coraliomargarita sp. SDUM461003]MDQ8209075.1 hypothetical protein [Coraliomargarita sp. SDUM461003]
MNILSSQVSLVGLLALAIPAYAQSVIYTEDFGDPRSSIQSLNAVDWDAREGGGTPTNYNSSNTNTNNGPVVGVSSDDNAYLFHNDPGNGYAKLWWATDFTATDYSDLTEITFALRNNSASENIQVAIESDGNWYVSDSLYNGTGSGSTFSAPLNLDFTSAAWDSLDFGTMAASVGAADPSTGTVSKIGFYTAAISDNVRIDSISVSAIPEPAQGSLLIGIAALICGLGRRWTRS